MGPRLEGRRYRRWCFFRAVKTSGIAAAIGIRCAGREGRAQLPVPCRARFSRPSTSEAPCTVLLRARSGRRRSPPSDSRHHDALPSLGFHRLGLFSHTLQIVRKRSIFRSHCRIMVHEVLLSQRPYAWVRKAGGRTREPRPSPAGALSHPQIHRIVQKSSTSHWHCPVMLSKVLRRFSHSKGGLKARHGSLGC